jgi:thiamine-phosphate pyrophosphorylase
LEIRRLAPDFLIGLSCNTLEQARKLGEEVAQGTCPVSYFNIGPLYATATKEGLREFIGPQAVEQFTKVCPLPYTVMGGIKKVHIPELCAVGARRIAVVTAISKASNIAAETTAWIEEITLNHSDLR